jgi:hypothetical protein
MGDNNEPPLKRTLEEMFDINIERRMRLGVFVQALHPDLTELEALQKLSDLRFLNKMLETLINYYQIELQKGGDEKRIAEIRSLLEIEEEE